MVSAVACAQPKTGASSGCYCPRRRRMREKPHIGSEGGASRLVYRPAHRCQPRPVGLCMPDRFLGKAKLIGRRNGLPGILDLPIPSKADCPYRCLPVTGRDHYLPHPGRTVEVEHVDTAARIFRPGTEAKWLHENSIEEGRGAGRVKPLQVEALVDRGVAPVLGGRQRGGQDNCVRVRGPHSDGGCAQQPGVADRIDEPVSPVGRMFGSCLL